MRKSRLGRSSRERSRRQAGLSRFPRRDHEPSFSRPAALIMSTSLAGCQSREGSQADTLKIGAYSVVREVFHDGVIPAFAAQWKSKTGREVQFEESYNASGAQARSIASGFDADLAILSHEGDMENARQGRAGQARLELRAPIEGSSPTAWS